MAFNLVRIQGSITRKAHTAEPLLLHDHTVTVTNGATMQVEGFTQVLLRAEGYYYTFYAQASEDGVHWTRLPLTNVTTGRESIEVRVNGTYCVDVTGFRYLSCPIANGCMELTLTGTPGYEKRGPEMSERRPALRIPVPAQPEAVEHQDPYFGFCQDICTVQGKDAVYGYAGNAVYRSDDLGANIAGGKELKYFPNATVNVVHKLENGAVLVGLKNDKENQAEIWISDPAEEAWEKVYTVPTPGVHFSMWFGHNFYRNLCLMAEYGGHNVARNVYLSADYGQTWRKIFEAPVAPLTDGNAGTHIHDVCYDPYGNLIWICTGDGVHSHNVYWSRDFGKNWNKLFLSSRSACSQFTQICPMPQCILFVSDNAQHAGVFRINRQELQMGTPLHMEPAFFLEPVYNAESPIAVHHAADGRTGAVYFGWTEQANAARMVPCVIGTCNGYDFFTVWRGNKIPKGKSGYVGVAHISGVSKSGKIAVSFNTDEGYVSNRYHTVTFDAPEWK